MKSKLTISIKRTNGYGTLESREITIEFPGEPDEDLLRQTFAEADAMALTLRDKMDDAGIHMESSMELRAPIEVPLLDS